MLNNEFTRIAIDSIVINPDRQRKKIANVAELAASIARIGLIHPIVITPAGELVAGERRLTAVRELGWTHIPAQYTTEIDVEEMEIIELEENAKREDLPWRDRIAAIARFHTLRLRGDSTWTISLTGADLSMSASAVSQAVRLQRYIDEGHELICAADTFTVARNIMERLEQRASESESADIEAAVSAAFGAPPPRVVSPADKPTEATIAPVAKQSATPAASEGEAQREAPFLHADFTEWAQLPLAGDKINFLHCDFPYGIGYDKHNGGAAGTFGGYEDTKEVYWHLINVLTSIMDTHIAKSAHMLFWLSARQDIVQPTMEALRLMGWTVNPVPLIWWRSDNAGILPDPKRGPRQVYELALMCSRGDRFIVQPVSNVFPCPKSKEVHGSEKPRPMLAHFFRMFIDASTVMLDPTAGSGNAVLVAGRMGAKAALGIERDESFYDSAVLQFKRNVE